MYKIQHIKLGNLALPQNNAPCYWGVVYHPTTNGVTTFFDIHFLKWTSCANGMKCARARVCFVNDFDELVALSATHGERNETKK